jgi:hypothetical protein
MKDFLVGASVLLFFIAIIGGGIWWKLATYQDCRDQTKMSVLSCLYMVMR